MSDARNLANIPWRPVMEDPFGVVHQVKSRHQGPSRVITIAGVCGEVWVWSCFGAYCYRAVTCMTCIATAEDL